MGSLESIISNLEYGRGVTLRDFVVDVLVEHDQHHADEIKARRERIGV